MYDQDLSRGAIDCRYNTDLVTALFLASWSLPYHHLVTVLWTFRTRLARTLALSQPTPNRTRLLITLGLSSTTSMRMVAPVICQNPSKWCKTLKYADLFIAMPRTCGRLPSHLLLPALPKFRFFHNGLETFPIVATHSCKTFLTSPLCSLTWVYLPESS